jgi:glycerophosphoryl diester phosphodiesterase
MTLVSAHRGESAVEAVIASGADMIETDVRRGLDGTLVLSHDPVAQGDRPMALAELLARVAGRIALNLEIKEAGLEDDLLALVDPRTPGLLVTSFLPEVLRAVSAIDPRVATGLLLEAAEDPYGLADRCGAAAVMAEREMISGRLLDQAARLGRPLWVWTVNDPSELARLMAEPAVTGVITDNPGGAPG